MFRSGINTRLEKLWTEDNTIQEDKSQVRRYLSNNTNHLDNPYNLMSHAYSDKSLHRKRQVWSYRKHIYCPLHIAVLVLWSTEDSSNPANISLGVLDLRQDNTSLLYKASIDWSLYYPSSWRRFLLHMACMKQSLQDNTPLEDTCHLTEYHSTSIDSVSR